MLLGFAFFLSSGAEGDRTPDLMSAIHALSQLSYSPIGSGRESRDKRTRCGRSGRAALGVTRAHAGELTVDDAVELLEIEGLRDVRCGADRCRPFTASREAQNATIGAVPARARYSRVN